MIGIIIGYSSGSIVQFLSIFHLMKYFRGEFCILEGSSYSKRLSGALDGACGCVGPKSDGGITVEAITKQSVSRSLFSSLFHLKLPKLFSP